MNVSNNKDWSFIMEGVDLLVHVSKPQSSVRRKKYIAVALWVGVVLWYSALIWSLSKVYS